MILISLKHLVCLPRTSLQTKEYRCILDVTHKSFRTRAVNLAIIMLQFLQNGDYFLIVSPTVPCP